MDEPSVSMLLEKLRPDLNAERVLKEQLISEAKKHALKTIAPDLQGRISASEVACSAASSLMSDVKHGRLSPSDGDALFRLLADRAKKKAIDQVRRHTSQKRDARKDRADAAHSSEDVLTPAGRAAVNEQAQILAFLICEAPDELRRCITHLGILGDFSPAVIHASLEKQDWMKGNKLPSVSTMRLWIAAERARILAVLNRE